MENDDTLKAMRLVDLALDRPKYTYEMRVNAPKPPGDFAAVLLVDERNPGRDKNEVIKTPDGFINRTTGVRILTFQVLFTEGIPMSSKFIAGFMRPDVQDYMVSNDLAVLKHKKLENKTLTLETNWEIRESVYIECLVRRTFESGISIIETVEATGQYNEGDMDVPITIQIKEP